MKVSLPQAAWLAIAITLSFVSPVTPCEAGPQTVRVGPSSVPASKATATRLAPPKSPRKYSPKFSTIGHEILALESVNHDVTEEMLQLLDDVIEQARAKIPVPDVTLESAEKAMKAVDDLLVGRGFVYPPVGLTQCLSDGLTPRRVPSNELERLVSQPHNVRRRSYIEGHKEDPFYFVDCDTASFLYLSIAESMKWPLFLVEVPEHNFVRWYEDETHYVNWETMDGFLRSDESYRQGFAIPSELVTKGVFLSKMTRSDTLGYEHFCVGIAWERARHWKEAQAEYVLATQQYGRVPGGWNNLAWSLVTARDPALRDGKRAIGYAQHAVSIWRSANELDTLACAYAEAADFPKAIETEIEAFGLEPRPEFQVNLGAFQAGKTWIEAHPDEPQLEIVVNANR